MHGCRMLPVVVLLLVATGCSRCGWRLGADRDAWCILHSRSAGMPWRLPADYSIDPPPASRMFFPSSLVDPALPMPAPQLYAYHLSLATRPAEPDNGEARALLTDQPLDGGEDGLQINPIPVEVWEAIPVECRRRMADFDTMQREANLTSRTFGGEFALGTDTGTARLTLRDIIDQALLNSREYQSQKETLYLVALRLSLERFDYQFRFTPNGLTSALNWTHDRSGGITTNSLSIPTAATGQKMLVTGGDFLARFANSVLLTFNGPDGFSADVSSELLFELSQPLIQRDIEFESLTQAERDVIYAARDFARFRKEFFVDFASQYYSLIRAFRQVEIDAQNYFSLVRAFNQAEAEYRAGLVPRFQVDQVEQNLLGGRGRLIATCNGLEQSLDSLKLQLGIPVETPINIDLTELDELTRRDQLSVSGDLINRVRRRLASAQQQEPDRIELLSTGVVLVDRILDANEIRVELGLEPIDVEEFRLRRARMRVESTRITAAQIARDLEAEAGSESPSVPVVFQRTMALVNEQLVLAGLQLELAELLAIDESQLSTYRDTIGELRDQSESLRLELEQMIREEQLILLPDLVRRATGLRERTGQIVAALDRLNGASPETADPSAELEQTIAEMSQLLQQADQVLAATGEGLVPVEIDADDAMLTALLLRFDLMNQRGSLADDWRQVKLAADDLRSVLNLNVSQRIGTRRDSNNLADFTFDESQTQVQVQFDAPVNRLAQRNAWRGALIGYQAGLRNLSALEDNIKFAVRNDLRNLAVDREQYAIAVASAALAFERVVSTSLEFRLGTGGVSARDFLEAQTAYTDALSDVASRHIDYILDRMQLFFDMELLEVDETGFWQPLYDDGHQPETRHHFPPWTGNPYGCLPDVCYSDEMLRMLCVPTGVPVIHRATPFSNGTGQQTGDRAPEPLETLPEPHESLPAPVRPAGEPPSESGNGLSAVAGPGQSPPHSVLRTMPAAPAIRRSPGTGGVPAAHSGSDWQAPPGAAPQIWERPFHPGTNRPSFGQ